MKKVIKTKDVSELVGLHRRTIQEYQKHGVVSKPPKDEYGHFLYSESDIEDLWEAKFFHELGYTIPEIRERKEDKNNQTREQYYAAIIEELNAQKQHLENLIFVVEKMKKEKKDINSLQRNNFSTSELGFDGTVLICSTARSAAQRCLSDNTLLPDNIFNKEVLTEDFITSIYTLFDSILDDYHRFDYKNTKVQKRIKQFHKQSEDICTNSILLFKPMIEPFLSCLSLYDLEFDKLEYVRKSFDYYYKENIGNDSDQIYDNIMDEIFELLMDGYSENSAEVQQHIQRLQEFFDNAKYFAPYGWLRIQISLQEAANNPECPEGWKDILISYSNSINFYLSKINET